MSVARTVVGFAIAPVVPGALLAAALLAHNEKEAASVFLAGLYLGYPIALLLGLPAHLVLQRNGLTSWLSYVISGALLGAALYFIIPPAIDLLLQAQGVEGGHTVFTLTVLPAAACVAATAALAFWLIARPDRAKAQRQA